MKKRWTGLIVAASVATSIALAAPASASGAQWYRMGSYGDDRSGCEDQGYWDTATGQAEAYYCANDNGNSIWYDNWVLYEIR